MAKRSAEQQQAGSAPAMTEIDPKMAAMLQIMSASIGKGIADAMSSVTDKISEGQERMLTILEKNRAPVDAEEAQERRRRKVELPRGVGEEKWRDLEELEAIVKTKRKVAYFIGMVDKSPIEYVVLLGVSFEKRIAHWDETHRVYNSQRGRVAEFPEELAAEIDHYAKQIWFCCHRVYDGDSKKFIGYERVERYDMHYPDQAVVVEQGRETAGLQKNEDGQPVFDWLCCRDLIILQRSSSSGATVQPTDVLVSHNAALQERLNEAEAEKQELKKRLAQAHGESLQKA